MKITKTYGLTPSSDVNCSEGALVPNYVLAPTSITTMVGQPIRLPTVSNLAMTAGTETYSVSNPCSSVVYYGITSPINYTFGNLYFDPELRPIFWTPGTYTYTAKVDIYGSLCATLTTNLGTVTVSVGTNNVFSDLLINVDFDVVRPKLAGPPSGGAALIIGILVIMVTGKA